MAENTPVEPVQLVLTKGCHMHWGMSTPAALEAVRRHAPLVSCITNAVVTNITANVLLALGAAPAMVDITGEAGAAPRARRTLAVTLAATELVMQETRGPVSRTVWRMEWARTRCVMRHPFVSIV